MDPSSDSDDGGRVISDSDDGGRVISGIWWPNSDSNDGGCVVSESEDYEERSPKKRGREDAPEVLVWSGNPLPFTEQPILVEFESAKMWVRKTHRRHFYNQSGFVPDGYLMPEWRLYMGPINEFGTEPLVIAKKIFDKKGKARLDVDSFYYTRSVDEEVLDQWASEKFGKRSCKIKALRSKRGAKFLRLCQIDMAAMEIVEMGHVPTPAKLWVVDVWRPQKPISIEWKTQGIIHKNEILPNDQYSDSYGEVGLGNLTIGALEKFVGEKTGRFNSRLGDGIEARKSHNWPTITESLLKLYPESTPPETLSKARTVLQEYELRTDTVRDAAKRIKYTRSVNDQTGVNGSIYGLYQTEPGGIVVFGTAGKLCDWTGSHTAPPVHRDAGSQGAVPV